MRVALVDHAHGTCSGELAGALRAAGHDAHLLSPAVIAPVEAILRRRGFATPLTSVALATAALVRGRFHLAHAFSVPDALGALAWGRLTGRPVVFTCVEELRRDSVAYARLRLSALRHAASDTNALIAADDRARAGLQRWLAASPRALAAGDAAAHEALYRELIARPGGSV